MNCGIEFSQLPGKYCWSEYTVVPPHGKHGNTGKEKALSKKVEDMHIL